NLPTNTDVRSMIRSRAIIDAIISLPDVTFMPYSTAKSSILFLHKKCEGEVQGSVFMAEAENVGRKPNGDPLYADKRGENGHRVLQNDLPRIAAAYGSFKEHCIVEDGSCFVTRTTVLDD